MNERVIMWDTFGGQTFIHPVALGFTLLMGVLILCLNRRAAIIPLIIGTIFIPIL